MILLDAGDLFQGTLASNLSEGEVVIDAINALGYDAAAVGNHEFDYGPGRPALIADQPGEDPFGALKARIAQAHFPLLSTNIYEARLGPAPAAGCRGDGTALIERKGVKIGIIGLTTPQTPTTTVPVNVASLRFAARSRGRGARGEAAARARRRRSSIAVMHAGGKCANWDDPHDTVELRHERAARSSRCWTRLPQGTLDVVVAGHVHALVGALRQRHAGHRDLGLGSVSLVTSGSTRVPLGAAARRMRPA